MLVKIMGLAQLAAHGAGVQAPPCGTQAQVQGKGFCCRIKVLRINTPRGLQAEAECENVLCLHGFLLSRYYTSRRAGGRGEEGIPY